MSITTPTEVAPEPGSAAYDAKMVALGETLEAPSDPVDPPEETPAPAGDRPVWLPEKFKSPEDMAKAYSELEKKQSAPVIPTTPEAAAAASTGEAGAVLAEAGLNMDDYSNEYLRTGELAEDSYAKLAKAGISKQLVDGYIAGQQAQADVIRKDVFTSVGGEDTYASMMGWAAKSLPASDVSAYNKAMDSGDPSLAKLAVAGLHSKFTVANPTEPKLLQGGTGSVGAEGFESTQQVVVAMRDPRYKVDPAYRKSVDRRLTNSNIF